MRSGHLYQLTFPGGGIYIGITREGVETRVKRHIRAARAGKPYALSQAIRKYGEESFTAAAICEGNWRTLTMLEVTAIDWLASLAPSGYNMTKGGEGAFVTSVSEATKQKISAAMKGRKCPWVRKGLAPHNKGKTGALSDATREKMSMAASARMLDAAQREKLRAPMIGRKIDPEVIARRVATRRANGKY